MGGWCWLFTHLEIVLDVLSDFVRQFLPPNSVACPLVIPYHDLFGVFSPRPGSVEKHVTCTSLAL